MNKYLNELGGERQTNFDKQRIREIVKEAQNTEVKRAAAIYFYGITKHPFRGANRRTAYFAADVFLRKNGYAFSKDFTTSEIRNLFSDIRDKGLPFVAAYERLSGFILKI